MSSEMVVEQRGSTLLLTLTDPATRNSLSAQANAAGSAAVLAAADDDALRCIVLRGAGAHFSAGGNVRRLAGVRAGSPDDQARTMEHFHRFIEVLHQSPKPVIAAVEGFAAGGGAALALACDLIVAAEDARFVLSYGKIGVSPDGGSSWHLARRLPRGVALQMLWLPEPMSAREWQSYGLVHFVTDSGHALATALVVAGRLAQMAPNTLASAKALVDAADGRELRAQLDAERDHFLRNLFHANGGEGLQAFLDKRAPRFQ